MRAMRRAIRSSHTIKDGREILELVRSQKSRNALVKAAETGVPPVTAISHDLIKLIGPRRAGDTVVKQFTGMCVRGVLEEEGFAIADRGVRVSKDPIFRTGKTYQRIQTTSDATPSLIARFVQALDDEEAEEAMTLLRQRVDKSA